MSRPRPTVERLRSRVYVFPTAADSESDGTLSWSSTTAVTVEVEAAGLVGLGWTYSAAAAADLIEGHLRPLVVGSDPNRVTGTWEAMLRAGRNLGRPGIVSAAVSAVDIALHDLRARLLDVPLTDLFGRARDAVPVYGSGGFTNLTDEELDAQVDGWLAAGCPAVKIKVGEDWGSRPERDLARTEQVRDRVGDSVEVMVDANGGYSAGQARRIGRDYDDLGVVWLEEPVSSDDLAGLALLRHTLRADVAAGEYADSARYCERMLTAGAVDCLQADVTRVGGYTGWLRCAAVAAAHGLQISGHCAPSLSAPVAAAVTNLRHVEWFIDHARLEPLLVQEVPPVVDGQLIPLAAAGHGMRLRPDADEYAEDGHQRGSPQ